MVKGVFPAVYANLYEYGKYGSMDNVQSWINANDGMTVQLENLFELHVLIHGHPPDAG